MRKQWVSVGVMGALGLGLIGPAWADCKVQMVLSAPGVGNTATGTAEKKVAAATLKSPAVNKFEVNVHAAALHPYAVMVNGCTPTSAMTLVGGIFADASGVGEFDLKGSADPRDVHRG